MTILLALFLQDLSSVPQSGRITLDAHDKPLVEVCEAISKQAGFRIEWGGDKEATTSISVKDEPMLAVLAELCRKHKCMFEEFQSADGRYIKVPGTFDQSPVLAYQVKGPVVLIWHGLMSWEKYNFKDPKNPIKVTRYGLKLYLDPRGHARAGGDKASREFPVTFRAGGGSLTLKSDHDPTVFSSSGPTWEFEPRSDLSGDRATLEVKLPFYMPTRISTAELPLKEGSQVESGRVRLSLESVKSEKKKDFFKETNYVEHTVVVKLIHADAEKPESPEKLALAGHDAVVFGQDGSRHPARIESASGMSGPTVGYRYEIRFKSTDENFKLDKVGVEWAWEFQSVELPFKLEDVPLKQP